MQEIRYRVAIIGCGRMGQDFAHAYATYPDTQIVAIAEYNPERRRAVGERFAVNALYPDVHALLGEVLPDIAVVATPTKYMKEAVMACAEAGVRGISTEKPIAAVLADADAMVEACASRRIVFAGGRLHRAMDEVQQVAQRIRRGEFGAMQGVCVHRFGGEVSGAGCQQISILRLFTEAEVEEVIAWGMPSEALASESDDGLILHAHFRLSNGLNCPVFGTSTPYGGVDVWNENALVRWDWAPPEIFQGRAPDGSRHPIYLRYEPYRWSEFGYLTGSIRSFLTAMETGSEPWISGHDLRQALEVAIAAKLSARLGSVPIRLPLQDRALRLYPRAHRWAGGDATGNPQLLDEAAGRVPPTWDL
jgi:predicted dehydrogenase